MDIKLHYTQQGSGVPLILLHGNGEDSSYFVHQIDHFAPSYCVIAVDTRGHGKSPRGEGPFSIKQFAVDLKCFLDEMGITKAHFLGFSDGGNIALTFALDHPEYIEKLILNGADLTPKGVKPAVQIPICIGYAIASFCAVFSKKAVAKKEMLELMVTQPNISTEELHCLSVPTLVIVGDKDLIKESHSREIANALPNARLQVVSGTHFVAKENPEEFNRVVQDFLETSTESN